MPEHHMQPIKKGENCCKYASSDNHGRLALWLEVDEAVTDIYNCIRLNYETLSEITLRQAKAIDVLTKEIELLKRKKNE